MKQFFRFLFVILIMSLSFMIKSPSIQAKEVLPNCCYQNSVQESVVLVANNIFNGEISSYNEKQPQSFSGNTCHLIAFSLEDNSYTKNNVNVNKFFIHKLSTNNQKVQQIRAP